MTDEGQQEDQEMRRIRTTSRPVMASALVALLVSALVPAVAAAHTPSHPITFSVSIGEECIYGTASDGASVTLTLKSAEGRLKERATFESASESGSFEHCSSDGDVVEIGDRIRAYDGTSGHLLVVPVLSLVINRVDDYFKGRAPAGDYVRLICRYGWEPCNLSWRIRANSQGMWGYKPQGFGVTGHQRMSLNWKSDAGDLVAISARGPHVDVTIGSAAVRGSTRANGIATVVLRRAGSNDVAATAVTRAGPDGLFQTKFRNQSGKLVKVRVGDRITSDVSSDVNLIVPNVTLSVDAASGEATGTCTEDTAIITVRVIRNGESDGSTTFPLDDLGSFETTLGDLDLVPGEIVTVTCFWEGDGDLVGRQVIVQ